jgi:hypothetical protein
MSRDPQHEDNTQRVLDQPQATLLTLDTVTAQETTPAPEGQNASTNKGHTETDDGPCSSACSACKKTYSQPVTASAALKAARRTLQQGQAALAGKPLRENPPPLGHIVVSVAQACIFAALHGTLAKAAGQGLTGEA